MNKEDKERIEKVEEQEKFRYLPIDERVIHKLIGSYNCELDEEWIFGARILWSFLNTPKEAICERWDRTTCPTCEEAFDEECNDGYYQNDYLDICPYCGQKLSYN